jgi:hypothetical protein
MAHRVFPSDAAPSSTASRSPPPLPEGSEGETISLRPIKDAVRRLNADHPLRIVLQGEPDEMSRLEFGLKLMGWLRLAHCAKE